jgi:gluconokinase
LASVEPQHFVVMGVSASGKTTIANLLAEHLEYVFADGDDFHPAANVAKMAHGEPLTDADRAPWLQTIAAWIANHHGGRRSTVLACSALKRRYRDTLRAAAPQHVFFVHLTASREALLERMQHRKGHFMPSQLLDSQLATLEPLQPDEPGMTVDATPPPNVVVGEVLERLAGTNAR